MNHAWVTVSTPEATGLSRFWSTCTWNVGWGSDHRQETIREPRLEQLQKEEANGTKLPRLFWKVIWQLMSKVLRNGNFCSSGSPWSCSDTWWLRFSPSFDPQDHLTRSFVPSSVRAGFGGHLRFSTPRGPEGQYSGRQWRIGTARHRHFQTVDY